MSGTSKFDTPQAPILPASRRLLEGLDGFGQRVLTRPVQQIQVDVIGIHPSQAGLAGGRHLVTLPGDGLPDDFFGGAIGAMPRHSPAISAERR